MVAVMRIGSRLLVLAVLLPTASSAQMPRLQIGVGVHAQSVGGEGAGGLVAEVAVTLPVAPFLGFRPEVSWAYAPSQGEDLAYTSAGSAGNSAGGLPHLVFTGASLVVERPTLTTGRWYGFAGAAVARGSGNRSWSAIRPAFVPHLGLGLRPLPAQPRFGAEFRYRYAPHWFDAPLRYFGLAISWTF